MTETPSTKTSDATFRNRFKYCSLAIFIGGAIYAAVGTVSNSVHRKDDIKAAQKRVMAVFAQVEDQDQVRKLVQKHSDRCYAESYKIGGTSAPSGMDADKYVALITQAIDFDLRVADGSLKKMIHDARFGPKDKPIAVPPLK